MTRTCPSCGAQSNGSVCEYCGTRIPEKTVDIADILGNGATNDVSSIDVIPFTATEKQAVSAIHKRLGSIQNQIKNELSELGRGYNGLSVSITETKTVYVPFNALKDANKVTSIICNANAKDLPQGFPTSLSGRLWEKIANRVYSDEKSRQLNRASAIVAIKDGKPTNKSDNKFIMAGETTYLPFWVIVGQLGSQTFRAYVLAGCKNAPELINIITTDGDIKNLYRKANDYTYSDYENAVKGRKAKHKTEVAKEEKRSKISNVAIWIFILLGAAAGVWFGSFMNFYTDVVGTILLGGLLAAVGGGIGFLISLIFCKFD